MDNKIVFGFERIENLITRIQDISHDMDVHLKKCRSIVDENVGVNGTWSGQSASRYLEEWAQEAAKFSSFVADVDKIAEVTKNAHSIYTQAENS